MSVRADGNGVKKRLSKRDCGAEAAVPRDTKVELEEEEMTSVERPERHDPESFILVIAILGALTGTLVGYGVDQVLEGRRLLALLAAFSAVIICNLFRLYLSGVSRSLQLWPPGSKVPPYLWLSICVATIIGGLAGHDISEFVGISSGAIIGFGSGVLASLSMALLMVLYLHEHPVGTAEF